MTTQRASRLWILLSLVSAGGLVGLFVSLGGRPHAVVWGDRILYLAGVSDLSMATAAGAALVLLSYTVWRTLGRLASMGALLVLLASLGLLLFFSGVSAPPEEEAWVGSAAQKEATANRTRTLIIGIDALSWNRLLPLMAEGRLPHLARLMETGAYGTLHSERSVRPLTQEEGYWSPVVWTSLATGVTVEKHGITGFQIEDARGKPRIARTHHRRAPTFWTLWSDFGRKVGVVGWWVTFPAERVNGIVASSLLGLRGFRDLNHDRIEEVSWFKRRPEATHPKWYRHTVAQEIGTPKDTAALINQRLFPIQRYPLRGEEDRRQLHSVLWQDQLFLRVTKHMMENEDFDLYAVYFEGIDLVSHHHWEFMAYPENIPNEELDFYPADSDAHTKIVDNYYEVVDEYVGELLQALGWTDGPSTVEPRHTVFVVSDHGFRTAPTHTYKADHSSFGVFIASGRGVRRNHSVNLSLAGSLRELFGRRLGVHDVLPTLLYLNHLPVSHELDGEVAWSILEPGFVTRYPLLRVKRYGPPPGAPPEPAGEAAETGVAPAPDLDSADRKEMEDRLKSLGYLK